MNPKDADGIANSVDPDQIAPTGAVLLLQEQCALLRVFTVCLGLPVQNI